MSGARVNTETDPTESPRLWSGPDEILIRGLAK